jgi:hypothetical protein
VYNGGETAIDDEYTREKNFQSQAAKAWAKKPDGSEIGMKNDRNKELSL